MKTFELTGAALDWAVGKADQCDFAPVKYSTKWEFGGPIIEQENMDLMRLDDDRGWKSVNYDRTVKAYGPTPLIAAMRCYVASRLGDEVEIPLEVTA